MKPGGKPINGFPEAIEGMLGFFMSCLLVVAAQIGQRDGFNFAPNCPRAMLGLLTQSFPNIRHGQINPMSVLWVV